MLRSLQLLAFIVLCTTPSTAAETISQAALLGRLIDLDRLTQPPATGERLLLFSSYDRKQLEARDGRYTHWDSDDDAGHFLHQTPDGWDVLAEVKGPGAIVRMWVDQPAGRVRVVVDDRPVVDAPFADLFNGAVEPFGEPLSYFTHNERGANLYFPIGFSRGCQVQTKNFGGTYQIDVAKPAPGTRVAPFRTHLDDDAQKALERVVAALRQGLSDRQVFGGRKTLTVAVQEDLARDAKFVETFDEPGTVRALYVSLTDRVAPREMYAMHNCIIRIWWDGSPQPDIELPLASFFGSGFDRNPYNSLVMGTDKWLDLPGLFASESYFMYCYFPMPFQTARIEIENRNKRKIGVMLYMRVANGSPAPDRLRFRARFRKEDPCTTFDYPMLETRGPGRVVGAVLNIDNPRSAWWGAGDHKIWLNGEPIPSILGTGTADYFGNISGLVADKRPLHGASLVNTTGKNSAYRWHIADDVPFTDSIRFTLENWQKDRANDVYYSSVVYWYGPPGATDAAERLSERDLSLPGLRIPGSVEIEGRIVSDGWGTVLKQKYAGGVELSGGLAATITSTAPVEIDVSSNAAGRFRLKLRTHPRRSFGTVEVRTATGALIGTVKHDRDANGIYEVGDIDLAKGKTRVRVTCSRTTVLDCWVLEQLD